MLVRTHREHTHPHIGYNYGLHVYKSWDQAHITQTLLNGEVRIRTQLSCMYQQNTETHNTNTHTSTHIINTHLIKMGTEFKHYPEDPKQVQERL